jgi:hypothetical protein
MVKNYYPVSIEKLHKEIYDKNKIQNLIHENFCLYKYTKGKNKEKFCLNKFRDINELQYCFMHRWEMKSWIKCNSLNCNGKTKIELCRKCKKIYNSQIPDVELPFIDDKERYLLSDIFGDNVLIERIYINGFYIIKNYNTHDYYKKYTLKINLILPKYVEGKKIKKIKNNEYCFYNKNRNDIKLTFEDDLNYYINYINKNKNKLLNIIKIIIKLKRIRKKYYNIKSDHDIFLNQKPKQRNSEISKTRISNEITNAYPLESNIVKCKKCFDYKNLIKNITNIVHFIMDELANVFFELNEYNKIKIIEIHKILKKPKIKPIDVNKLYNDFPKVIGYNDKIIKIIKEEIKELDKVSCDIFNDIDRSIINNIIINNNILKKYNKQT